MSHDVHVAEHTFPIYILTIQSAHSRHQKLKKTWGEVFGRLGRNVEDLFFYGWYGPSLWGDNGTCWVPQHHERLIESGFVARYSGPRITNLSPAECATALGFLQICRIFLRSEHSYLLYLEDDSNLFLSDDRDRKTDEVAQDPSTFLARLEQILDVFVSSNLDVLRLGACFSHVTDPHNTRKLGGGLEVRPTGFALGLHGLLLSRRAVIEICRDAFPLRTTIDHQLLLTSQRNHLKDYECVPHIIGQDLIIDPYKSLIGYSKLEHWCMKILIAWHLSPQALMGINLNINELRSRLVQWMRGLTDFRV